MLKDKDKELLESIVDTYGKEAILAQIAKPIVVVETENSGEYTIIDFVSKIESVISRCKEIHWSALDDKTHVLSGELISILTEKQDEIAEDYMGYCGEKIKIGILSCCSYECVNLPDLLKCFREDTVNLYSVVCSEPMLSGIKSTINSLLKTINTYIYRETQK